jgi:radical SAM protein with 4Fe4S-binding SPASM domain
MVVKNIPKWKDIFNNKLHELSVHGCINKKTIKHLFTNYKYFKDCHGFKKIWYLPIAEEDWDEEDVKEYRKQMGLIYNNILSVIKQEKSINEVYNYAPLDRCLNLGNRASKPCGAGNSYISINTLGEIFPCHQFYFNDPNKDTLIGNIYSGIDDEKRRIYIEYSNDDFDGCNKCEHDSCYRCIANNYQHRGSILSQTKGFYCALMKIDLYFETKLRKELINMGLLKNTQNQYANDNCKMHCDIHTRSTANGCDIVVSNVNNNMNTNNSNYITNNKTFIEDIIKDDKTYSKYVLYDGSIELVEKLNMLENKEEAKECCCNNESDKDLDVIASALHIILDKLDEILLKVK